MTNTKEGWGNLFVCSEGISHPFFINEFSLIKKKKKEG